MVTQMFCWSLSVQEAWAYNRRTRERFRAFEMRAVKSFLPLDGIQRESRTTVVQLTLHNVRMRTNFCVISDMFQDLCRSIATYRKTGNVSWFAGLVWVHSPSSRATTTESSGTDLSQLHFPGREFLYARLHVPTLLLRPRSLPYSKLAAATPPAKSVTVKTGPNTVGMIDERKTATSGSQESLDSCTA